jgi:hypothetical protein
MPVKAKREDWSIQEFAAASGFTWKHCYELCGRQVIPAVRVDGRWRLSRAAAEQYIAQRKKQVEGNGHE